MATYVMNLLAASKLKNIHSMTNQCYPAQKAYFVKKKTKELQLLHETSTQDAIVIVKI